MQIKQVTDNKEQMVYGEYRVITHDEAWCLTDASGLLPFSPEQLSTVEGEYCPVDGQLVEAGLLLEFDEGEMPEITGRVTPIERSEHPLRLLPNPELPKPELVMALDEIIQSMRNSSLRRFLIHLFQDVKLALKFCQVPASYGHHHSEDGGLLAHTVEMASYAMNGEFMLAPDQYERELLVVACIVHDIGKVKTHDRAKTRFIPGEIHELVSIELIAGAMATLERKWPKAATDLRMVLADELAGRKVSNSKVSRLLQELDKSSAFRDASAKAFDGSPKWYQYARLGKGGAGRTYWRTCPLLPV